MALAGFALFAGMLNAPMRPEVDNVAVNEIAKQAALYWQAPERLSGLDYLYRFVIVDNEGSVRFASGEGLPDSLQAAIIHGFLPIDITIDSNIVGKALIEVIPDSYFTGAQKQLSYAAIISFILLCMLITTASSALYIIVVRPFRRLEAFAHKISTGNLDEPLPMDRGNIFGPFTQSFDLMRASLLRRGKRRLRPSAQKKSL